MVGATGVQRFLQKLEAPTYGRWPNIPLSLNLLSFKVATY
jgi:hypothetical protein